jgi:hypothetical protein
MPSAWNLISVTLCNIKAQCAWCLLFQQLDTHHQSPCTRPPTYATLPSAVQTDGLLLYHSSARELRTTFWHILHICNIRTAGLTHGAIDRHCHCVSWTTSQDHILRQFTIYSWHCSCQIVLHTSYYNAHHLGRTLKCIWALPHGPYIFSATRDTISLTEDTSVNLKVRYQTFVQIHCMFSTNLLSLRNTAHRQITHQHNTTICGMKFLINYPASHCCHTVTTKQTFQVINRDIFIHGDIWSNVNDVQLFYSTDHTAQCPQLGSSFTCPPQTKHLPLMIPTAENTTLTI